jgi:hypothetical protein
MVSTQDVGFGTLWTKLVGKSARWEPGGDDVSALHVEPGDPPKIGMGLVSIWLVGEGSVYVCDPRKGLKAIKDLQPPVPASEIYTALERAGAVVHVSPYPRRDSQA